MASFDFKFTEDGKYTPLSKLITAPYEDGLILKGAVTDLTELILPPAILAIAPRAFYMNSTLRRFHAGETLKIIQNEAFRGCAALHDVAYSIHTSVNDQAFCGCAMEDAVVTPLVYKGAFRNSRVKRVEFKKLEWGGVTDIPDHLLSGTQIESIQLPDDISTVGSFVFATCEKLKRAVFPDSVTYMGNNVFESCSDLEEFTMPSGVGGVPTGTFAFCGNLKRVRIADRPGGIGEMAFYACDALRELRIPKGIHRIGERAVQSKSLERVIFEGRTLKEVASIFGLDWLLKESKKVEIVCTDRTYIK